MEIAGIITAIGVFFAKAVQIIRAAGKLKKVKKEVLEAWKEGKEAYEKAQETIEAIKGYFASDSAGGKKLTGEEINEILKHLQALGKEIAEFTKESLEAKEAVSELIKEFKKKKS